MPEDAGAARSAYDATSRELAAVLAGSKWAADGGRALTFDDVAWTESTASSQESRRVPYVIRSSEREHRQEGGADIDVTTAAIETPSCTYLLTLTKRAASSGQTPGTEQWTVRCGAFEPASGYSRAEAATAFEVVGTDGELDALLGGTSAQLVSLLHDYCALYYPSATAATWSEEAQVDYSRRRVDTSFTLDGGTRAHVGVSYDMDTGSYVFGQ